MATLRKLLPTFFALVLLGGCSHTDISAYHGMSPVLDLQTYFNGDSEAWGQFQDRGGKVIKRFQVKLHGSWSGNNGRLQEDFSFDDGSHSQRIWLLTALGNGHYQGRAADIDGVAEGVADGPALHWQYTLLQPVDGKVYKVHMDDWMFLQDDRTLINRTSMSKFGIHLGDVTLFFRK